MYPSNKCISGSEKICFILVKGNSNLSRRSIFDIWYLSITRYLDSIVHVIFTPEVFILPCLHMQLYSHAYTSKTKVCNICERIRQSYIHVHTKFPNYYSYYKQVKRIQCPPYLKLGVFYYYLICFLKTDYRDISGSSFS